MAYAKRYVGGFVDKPSTASAIDATFLNAVEAALLKLLDTDGSVDGQVLQWIQASSKFGPALLLNKNVDAAAAIDWTKLDTAGKVTNASVSGAAAIARSKLDFGSGLVNADVAAAAAIAVTKLAAAPSARVYHNANQSTTTGVAFTLAFNSERFDTDTIHDTATNNSRLTCKTAGKYLIIGSVSFASSGAGTFREAWIHLNNSVAIAFDARSPCPGDITGIVVSTIYDLAVNDYVELRVDQDSGGALNILSSVNYSPEFSMVRISA